MDPKIAASIAGAVATAPMTVTMTALRGILPGQSELPLPPEEIVDNAAAAAGLPEPGDAETMTAHFGFGAAAGVAYLPLAGKSGLNPATEGALFGLAVWGGNYLGLMPGSGLYRPPHKDPAARQAMMIAAHVVWGAALGLLFHKLAGNRQSQEW